MFHALQCFWFFLCALTSKSVQFLQTRQTVQDPVAVNLLQENSMNVDDGGESAVESGLFYNLPLPSQDHINREFTFQSVSPEPPHMRLSGYPISTSCSDMSLQQIAAKFPGVMSQIPPPSLTLQPPTSPPCVQSFDDDFHPPSSPSDILSHYGFSSSLSSTGLGSHYSQSPLSLSPQSSFHAPPSPREPPPSCYKRHLSLPTSPSQPIVSKFNFLTPPLRSPAAPHRSASPSLFPLSPRALSPVPFGSANAAISEAQRLLGTASSLLPPSSPHLAPSSPHLPPSSPHLPPSSPHLSPSSPRHMLTVPMASSPCRSPNFFGPSLQPYHQSRSRSPSPISEYRVLVTGFYCCSFQYRNSK